MKLSKLIELLEFEKEDGGYSFSFKVKRDYSFEVKRGYEDDRSNGAMDSFDNAALGTALEKELYNDLWSDIKYLPEIDSLKLEVSYSGPYYDNAMPQQLLTMSKSMEFKVDAFISLKLSTQSKLEIDRLIGKYK